MSGYHVNLAFGKDGPHPASGRAPRPGGPGAPGQNTEADRLAAIKETIAGVTARRGGGGQHARISMNATASGGASQHYAYSRVDSGAGTAAGSPLRLSTPQWGAALQAAGAGGLGAEYAGWEEKDLFSRSVVMRGMGSGGIQSKRARRQN